MLSQLLNKKHHFPCFVTEEIKALRGKINYPGSHRQIHKQVWLAAEPKFGLLVHGAETHTQLPHLSEELGEGEEKAPKYKCQFFRFATFSQKFCNWFVSTSHHPKARIRNL